MKKQLVFILSILFFYFNSIAATYYVRSGGNDNLDGLSIANAWKTLDKVKSKNFAAGDILLLEGGIIFNGYLFFDKDDTGLPNNPITISSYGTGKATISSGDNYGFYVYNTSGFKITNIIIQGSGSSINFDDGLKILNNRSYTHLDYLFIDNIEVLGYGRNGILIEGKNYDAGFKNFSITNSNIHDNGESGINVMGDSLNLVTVYAHQNVYLANNKVYNTKGIANEYNVTGNGIKVSSSTGVTIEYNESYNNGGSSNSPIGGPIGIWVFDANNVIIQHNESHHNKSGGNLDGGGFDLDGGTTNSLVQYNYSHDNDGAGYLLAIHKNKNRLKGNTFRYNISQNDGRKNGYSSVYLWAQESSTGVEDLQFYNNTIYLSPPPSGNPTVVRIVGPVSNINFRNNIFYSTEWIYQIASTAISGIKFQGNCYFSSGDFNIWWNGNVYSSLESWRTATGQEKKDTTKTGFQTDPQLNSPGTAGTVRDLDKLTSITQYQLKSTSPMKDTGLDLSQFGVASGGRDYFGYITVQGSGYDVGAHEFGIGGTNTDISVMLTSPSSGTTITTGSSLLLTAHATSGDATISRIEFYRGTSLLGTSTTWPYKLILNNLSAGSYSITAKAFNSIGASKSSAAISFMVTTPAVPTLRNPENPENTVSGLEYSYYEGTWTALPDFNSLSPIKTGTTTNFNLTQRNKDDNFGFKFTGYIYVPNDDSYTFYTSSDEGSKLFIGTTLVVNNDGIHGTQEKSGSIGLKAGRHAITITYFEATGSEALTVSYSTQGISKTTIPASSLFRASENALTCTSTGNMLRELWTNVTGNSVTDLTKISRYPNTPTSTSKVTLFEGPLNDGDNYGARYRGYICAPTSGAYTFWIASDNDAELWLSSNEDPTNKVRIAYTEGYTASREWEKYPTQKSISIFLNKGRYYVEVIHKEGVGEDNMAVGWQLPNGTLERPIPGSRLTAYGESINNPPFVSISSPTNGATFISPASIAINATASDVDGSITKVEFYQGTTLIGTSSTAPYSFNWTNVSAGNYSLTAKAFDNSGSSTTSSVVSIIVNALPIVSITSPSNGASFIAPATITINANASDADGSINKVEFYQGTTLLGIDNTSPYSFIWNNVENGNYTLTAKAYDNLNATTTSAAVNIIVSNNLFPTTSITSPANGASFISPATITINANASDSDGSVTKVEFYQGTTLLGTGNTSPYSFIWNNVSNGSYSLTTKAYDNLNAITTSSIISITVSDNRPPSVSITSPSNGASFSAPASITINVNASDADGSIAKVEFYEGTNLLATNKNSPYSYNWTNVIQGNYTLTAKAFDNLGASSISTSITVSVGSGSLCNASGTIVRELWSNITGAKVINIPLTTTPTSISEINSFEGPINEGDNYGARYRGYLCAPITGNYTFWIASDDQSELWLSTNDNPANKTLIASVTGYTKSREWEKYTSQKSVSIMLERGKQYYIEALHKEGGGGDNLAVGWQLPDGTLERPIPGSRLSPFGQRNNIPPSVTLTSPANGSSFIAPANITITANASDTDGSIARVEFYQGTVKLGEDNSSPYNFNWASVASGTYTLTAVAFDNQGSKATSNLVTISVNTASNCITSGTLVREVWSNIIGAKVINIPLNTSPSTIEKLTLFEGPTNTADNYGARYKALICVPVTGNYTFWIASDDQSELWLSTNESTTNKVLIATITGYTKSREWEKYVTQKSASITLEGGKQYYIEALHKEALGGDNLAVGWQLPDGTMERPIPGIRLSPYSTSAAKEAILQETTNAEITVYPNPATDQLWIEVKGLSNNKIENNILSIQLVDLAGHSILKSTYDILQGKNTIGVDISAIPRGFYLIKAEYKGILLNRKIVIE